MIDVKKDVTDTVHSLEDLLTGKIDFNAFRAGEIAIFKNDVAQLPATAQAFVTAAVHSLETTASGLVGVGRTVLGPLIAEKTDDQATMVLNLLSLAGVPTGGKLLNAAEHAALDAIIDGLKAGLDRIGIRVATAGVASPSTASAGGDATHAQAA